jgi:hypothetical protein
MALNNVTVNFAPVPQGTCTSGDFNTLLISLNTLVSGSVTPIGSTSFYNFGDSEPSPDNRIYPWLKTVGGYPVAWFVYKDGDWRWVNPPRTWYCTTDTGVVNAYVTTTASDYPSTVSLTVGDLFLVKITTENTAGSTLSVNGFTGAPITNASVGLDAGAMVVDQTYIFLWDGTNFRLLNPTPATPIISVEKTVSALAVSTQAVALTPEISGIPKVVQVRYVNVTPEHGYTTDDEVDVFGVAADYSGAAADGPYATVTISAGQVYLTVCNAPFQINITQNTTGATEQVFTPGNWRFKVIAYA